MSTESSPLATAAAEADRVVKRQKVCSTKFAGAVDRLLAAVNDSRGKLQSGNGEDVLMDLKQHVTQLGVSSELHDQTKQLHGAIAKLGKVIILLSAWDLIHIYKIPTRKRFTACFRLSKRLSCQVFARPAGQLSLTRIH